jgi:hypothetical protein
MKFSIDIDCSPEEARTFFGLPDVAEFQKSMMAQIQERMSEHITAMDPEALMKTWLPMGTRAWETFQESFMQGFAKASPDKPKE